MNLKEVIIIVGHGSPEKEAGDIGYVAESVHRLIHPECGNDCVRTAYLQFQHPALPEAIKESVQQGAGKIIIHPFFLSSGFHVLKNIPEMLSKAREMYPGIAFVCTEPLGAHDKIAEIVLDRIQAVIDVDPL